MFKRKKRETDAERKQREAVADYRRKMQEAARIAGKKETR